MDFTLSDEQRLLKDSVDRLLADRYAFDQRKTYFKEPDGWSTALWSQYAELGLLGLPFAEEYGGFGGGAVEIMLVMEAFGRALILEPYLATVVLGGTAVRLAGSDAAEVARAAGDRRGQHEARVRAWRAAGALRRDRRDDHGEAERQRLGAGWREERGHAWRQRRHAGGQRAHRPASATMRTGITLFLVDAGANGVARRGYTMRDEQRAAEVSLSGVQVGADAVLGEVGNGLRADRAGDRGRHRRDRGRERRRDGGDARDDAGIQPDARAVRQADRLEPGGAAPAGGDADVAGAGPLDGDAGGDDGGRAGRRRARAQHRHGEGRHRPGGTLRVAERGAAAWRHRHDRGTTRSATTSAAAW